MWKVGRAGCPHMLQTDQTLQGGRPALPKGDPLADLITPQLWSTSQVLTGNEAGTVEQTGYLHQALLREMPLDSITFQCRLLAQGITVKYLIHTHLRKAMTLAE